MQKKVLNVDPDTSTLSLTQKDVRMRDCLYVFWYTLRYLTDIKANKGSKICRFFLQTSQRSAYTKILAISSVSSKTYINILFYY